ncbi:MAG: CAAX protease [Synechococcales cyanobacterium M58_A2018_015]|nr:CAAX protease [Synechococcales cyanobacterium M58_A2018_015]
MTAQALDQLGSLLSGAFSLSQEAFQRIVSMPEGQTIALLVVLVAGLSQAIGQSIILFINQVKPVRFVFSLVLNAILFTFGFLFLVFSTWLIGWFPGFVQVSWSALVKDLGLAYAPLLFSFLGALPYAGVPILNGLAVWHLLAMVAGLSAITGTSAAGAFTHVAVGWFALQILEGTVGQPIAKLGRRLSERVAGVEIAENRSQLTAKVQSGLETRLATKAAEPALSAPSVQVSAAGGSTTASPAPAEATAVLTLPSAMNAVDETDLRFTHHLQKLPQILRLGLILLGMILLFIVVALLLEPIRVNLLGWHGNLPRPVRWIVDLIWIGVVGVIFAGLLAPLETLGWWAGWYGEDIDTRYAPPAAPPLARSSEELPNRYVVYVDGVGQSGEAYTPDVVDFVEALQQVLPADIEFVQGLMMYSVINKPLDQDRALSWLWRMADRMRWQNPMAVLGLMVNMRNAWIVAVSADKRYGPIYNQGIAQVLYNGLLNRGYRPQSGVPITLIGYSGGAQMSAAAAPYLKQVLGSPIDVISLGGVMSANNNFLILEHLYHLVGSKDGVAALGPFLFPGRRKWFRLSYWNRALRKGKISEVDLGPVGHQVPGGIMDPNAFLPNGESHLQHTINLILSIVQGRFLVASPPRSRRNSNYERYTQADFNRPTYYPLTQTVDLRWYRPIGSWMGRLILPLPEERDSVQGVWLEVHHAEAGYEALVGQRVMLRWVEQPQVQDMVRAVTHDVHFSVDATYSTQYGGTIHPDRLNHWQQVDPLESLAGSHPEDDLLVMLDGPVNVAILGNTASGNGTSSRSQTALYIDRQPVQITGRYYALVQFIAPIAGTDRFQVQHFNAGSRQFDGWTEVVRLPPVIANQNGVFPSTANDLEHSPLNETGWYIYGAKDTDGCFVVQSLAPRALFRLQPERVVFGSRASYRYIRQESWADSAAQKGKIASVLCVGGQKDEQRTDAIQAAINDWQVGDRALVLHVYGGIGGNKREPAAATPLYFGHFSYGLATVVQDPLSNERRFDIQYYQVYTHNSDGLTAGTLHWCRYMGDRQFGWLGSRPVCDILIKFEPLTGYFNINNVQRCGLNYILKQLEAMTARYRIGDGTGATYVGPANNCSQDSNQALFAGIRSLSRAMENNQPLLQSWLAEDPQHGQQYQRLLRVQEKLIQRLQPLRSPRQDWESNEFNLGTTLEDDPLRNLWTGLGSWRTILPRKASDTMVQVFLKYGASVWVLRTNQVGGYDPDIEPISPMTL